MHCSLVCLRRTLNQSSVHLKVQALALFFFDWNYTQILFFFPLGPFTFTYNRGHGECKSPVSNIESCTEDSRLLLSFQACPDVSGTESTGKKDAIFLTSVDGNFSFLHTHSQLKSSLVSPLGKMEMHATWLVLFHTITPLQMRSVFVVLFMRKRNLAWVSSQQE